MNPTAWILVAAGVASSIILWNNLHSIGAAKARVFGGSRAPVAMAQMLLSSILVSAQTFCGIFIIAVLCILMLEDVITSESGLPLLSAVAGYLLAKNSKDVSIVPKDEGSSN